ncbi:putative proline--tRNA ligase [[Candida] railenensis]|uniref:proline--tRNA ligase n=1 Tax=[Candida] railenensis TaxID=45579 RepID=A0A9P0QPG9_9ASCO|nr:putative proline--tRNA ligase [[Candida] railenensis]
MALIESLAALSLATVSAEGAVATKTLVFKPKTAKTATPVPVLVFALQSTQTPSPLVAQAASVKEPRLAKDDLVQEFFAVSAKEVSIANLNKDLAGKIKIVIDQNIVDADESTVLELSTESAKASLPATTIKAFLESTGIELIPVDFSAAPVVPAPGAGAGAASASKGAKDAKKEAFKKEKEAAKIEGAQLIGITVDKAKDFSSWYSQVCVKSEMLDYYDVSGCYILRPNSYHVWEQIQDWFNFRIKKLGVKNSYFPMFVSQRVLEKEKDHIEGFAPEVAWVTKAGNSELDEHIAIRPTSETVMYPYYAKWIRSHRDLPLKLNQWNSVVRWEFKHPQPFLRTREFLWQEGHTAHLLKEEADLEVQQILDLYAGIYEELLAVPVVKGKKTENEKFAGGDYTTTCEGFIAATGRGIQGATSHHLGTNFSKMFDISVENPLGSDKPKVFAFQNSWGLSTRVIGVMVMTHSDNKGLVLPPRVSQYQVCVMPVGLNSKTSDEQKKVINDGAEKVEKRLKDAGVRVTGDYRENITTGWKFADWELKGLPVRLEYGPKDAEKDQVTAVRRDDGSKYVVKLSELETRIPEILEEMQEGLLSKARKDFDEHRVTVEEWKDFVPTLNKKNVIVAPWCGVAECEDDIKDSSAKKDNGEEEEVDEKAPSMGAKSLCIPYEQPPFKKNQKCVKCDLEAKYWCMFGRSY